MFRDEELRHTINIKPFSREILSIAAGKVTHPIIEVVPGQIVTRKRKEEVRVKEGVVLPDVERDILKLVVVERHKASGNIGLGLVKGFGLKRGAMASSIAHDSHNIVAVGVNDEDIFATIKEIERLQGGLVIAADAQILGALPLPIAGLLSDEPLETVAEKLEKLEAIASDLGCQLTSPFATLSFLALPVIPRAIVISGAGNKAFCSGEDLGQFSSTILSESSSLTELKGFTLRYNVASMVAGIGCPVIAAINGNAFGAGLALTLSCDLRIASDKSLFGVSDIARGYLMASGITQWLPRIVGKGKATELILTAKLIEAQEAHRIGLVHRVVPHQEVFPEVEKLAREIASKAPIALRYAKETVNKGLDLTLEQGLRLECDLYMLLHTTRDRIEGVKAFLEKRQPHFRGE